MDDTCTVELTASEIKRLIDALHEFFETNEYNGSQTSEADKVLLMKLVEALR